MRYLITVSSLTPGSGLTRYVFNLCGILKEGNELFVLTTHDEGSNEYALAELTKISPDIKLIALGKASKIGKYLKTMAWIRKISPDKIINNYNGVVQFVLPFIGSKVKVIHILHNDTDDFYRIGAINGKRIAGWIAPTQAIADHFNSYTGGKYVSRVEVIPHGVATAEHNERRSGTLEIVFAGVLYEHKGVKVLPGIIKKLLGKGIDLRFTIIGGGILADWLRESFRGEIENGTVTMTGVIDHERVYTLMSKADVFLYPTHLDAFGLVIAEAMMNGAVPVVTLLLGITDNLVDHGNNGFLLPQDDIDAFAEAIEEIYNDSEKRTALSRKAFEKAEKSLSMPVMKANYLSYLSNL
ncbi:MAG: glycosyltransferase family 4 protein [Bacteroides sp.]|nr:glycosyltransferase family 4 protein [Alistipes timonensis]MCM1310986.1 glycosyltransferase family 4 protein [Bacteroides sp.]MCM1405153.1 glycosyltransferase family 4 protein [[Clostridium] fimetarium]